MPLCHKNSQDLVDRSTADRALSDYRCAILAHADVTTGIDCRFLSFGKAYDAPWAAAPSPPAAAAAACIRRPGHTRWCGHRSGVQITAL
mmetsp:Transcript_3285/g.6234  ORF Transcript_3285/g.6234 Transcript_3285/m.6234 type:complete len:89 (-) Transcript_3285:30-296(-)